MENKVKFALVVVVSLVLFWNIGNSSLDSITINVEHVDPLNYYSTKGNIEVYAKSNNLNGILGCTVYSISKNQLKEYNKYGKIPSNVINTSNIEINSNDDYKNPICKITLDENMNMFSVPNYRSEMVIKKGVIMNPNKVLNGIDGPVNGFSHYENLLVEVTFKTNDNDETVYANKILTSTKYT